ncbi:MAG TPA: ATP-binding protein [Cellvibrionaceae bacterium]
MLKRAFFSLYFIIVLAILVAGWGLDRFYHSVTQTNAADSTDHLIFALLESRLDLNTTEGAIAAALKHYSESAGMQADLYRLDDFARSDLKQRIEAAELISIDGADNTRELYGRLADTPYILRLQITHALPQQQGLRDLLLLAFYLILALVIYLWTWPLIRDLRSLELQAKQVGSEPVSHRITLNPGSAVYQLGAEFNRMQSRIDELLSSYREMTYAVSHELRTPLARMKFALELAENITQTPKVQKQLDSLRFDVAEMDALINQLLSYAGFESQTQVLIQQPGDMGALVQQLQNSIADLSPRIDFQLVDYLRGEHVYCEWPLMERVVHNILSNAARYAHSRVKTTLSFDHEQLEVRIEDDGPGIPEEDRERVFDSFVRLRKTNTEVKGFGLGLAIVRRIMHWHKGHCRVVDSPLGGACFVLTWPQTDQTFKNEKQTRQKGRPG